MSENKNQNDNNVNNKLYNELKINKNDYTLSENNFYKPQKLKKIYSSQKNINHSKNNFNNSNRTLIDGFLNSKHGIFNLSDFTWVSSKIISPFFFILILFLVLIILIFLLNVGLFL